MAKSLHSVIKITVLLSLFNRIASNSFPEEKTLNISLQTILKPSLVKKIWQRNSCLTYHSRIGICLTASQCLSRNGTISGLCLAVFTVCCLPESQTSLPSLPSHPEQSLIPPELSLNSRCFTNSKRQGVCLNSDDCIRRMGTPDGLCTQFVICCQMESICGKTVGQNETEIVNDSYPETLNDANVCQVIVERAANVCQIRIGANRV